MSEPEPTKKLLERWQSGDESAAEAIYKRYSQRLCSLAETQIGERLKRRVGGDDITQSVFRSFFRRARDGQFTIDHSSSMWHLLVRIALHKIRKQAKRHHAQRRDVAMEVYTTKGALSPDVVAHDPTPAEAAALAEELDVLLTEVDVQEGEMFRMCLEGYSSPEIARQLSCSRWTVRRVLDRIGEKFARRVYEDFEKE